MTLSCPGGGWGFGQEAGRESSHYFGKVSRLAEAGVRLLHRCLKDLVWREMEYGRLCVMEAEPE